MVPLTEKSMTVGLPGELASAPVIAARSEPAPELLRFVTTIDREDTEVKVDVPRACAAAAPVEMAIAVDVHAAMQAVRNRILGAKGPAEGSPLRGNLKCVVRANIVSLLP
jgi:hypothetical protein